MLAIKPVWTLRIDYPWMDYPRMDYPRMDYPSYILAIDILPRWNLVVKIWIISLLSGDVWWFVFFTGISGTILSSGVYQLRPYQISFVLVYLTELKQTYLFAWCSLDVRQWFAFQNFKILSPKQKLMRAHLSGPL